jgi:hypothetical protein
LTFPAASIKVSAVKRFASVLLLGVFLGLGSGGLAYLHNLQHAAEDARMDALARKMGLPVLPHPHDDSNCPVHAQLHLQFVLIGATPILICLGLFLAFLSFIESPLIGRLIPARIDCRGPPHSSF